VSTVARKTPGERLEKRINTKVRRLITFILEYVAIQANNSSKRFVTMTLIVIHTQLLIEINYDQVEDSLGYSFADHG
jgi:hypothetical protein